MKRWFAPFREGIARAEQQEIPVFFWELYFYVLLPFWAFVYGWRFFAFFDEFIYMNNMGWQWLFERWDYTLVVILCVAQVACIIWQYLELRKFRRRFFVSLWCTLGVFSVWNVSYYFINGQGPYDVLWRGALYGLAIYYFYKRKKMFE